MADNAESAVPTITPEERGLACQMCGGPRVVTDRTAGVWTTCDYCGCDWWCVGVEYDYMDEPTAYACSISCEEGWSCDCSDGWDDEQAPEGCDCKVICSMGPTCPGAIFAGLDGAGCHRATSSGRPVSS